MDHKFSLDAANSNNNQSANMAPQPPLRKLDGRSKSLASTTSINLDDNGVDRRSLAGKAIAERRSSTTSATTAKNKSPRSCLAFKVPDVMVDSKENRHSNIVRTIQPNDSSNVAKTQPSSSSCLKNTNSFSKEEACINNNNVMRMDLSKRLQDNFSKSSNIKHAQAGAPLQKQQPTINIISNPSFEQNHRQTSRLSHSNIGEPSSTTTTNEQKATKSKPKPKRNAASLSSSLRRLITITFSRGSSSSTANNNSNNNANDNSYASSSQNKKTSKIKRDKATSSSSSASCKQDSIRRRQFSTSTRSSNTNAISQTRIVLGAVEALNSRNQNLPTLVSSSTSGDEVILTTNGRIKPISVSSTTTSKEGVSTQTPSSWVPPVNVDVAEIDGKTYIECPVCVLLVSEASTPYLASCRHRVCLECMQRYITTEINHSRLNITCPICSEPLHPNTIKNILQNEKYYLKYESFMLRRVLAAEPDARWCPAPDCGYVVLANGCASCPKLVCGRDGCNTSFCYHCKQEWHPNQTCSAASIQRNKRNINAYNIGDLIEESNNQTSTQRKSSKSSQQGASIKADDIKECPVCASRIIKMNDGSCNHMTCSICETEFCWLCMKEISDLHYFSPSGCTFWGKKPWSRKKKLLWQLGMLVGAPICIILIAGIAVPAIVIGIPVWAARKLHSRLERKPFSRYRKNAIITGGVLLSFVVSPIISAVALAIGIPILLGYVYGVVPLSLCRSSGGCLSAAPSLENLQHEFQASAAAAAIATASRQARDGISIDTAMSHKLGDPSIGDTSLYMSNISLETNSIGHVTNVEREDRESASNAALAGSNISQQTADDGNSTRALAGSIISKESGGYTLIPAEVHSTSSHLTAPAGQINSSATNVEPTTKPSSATEGASSEKRAPVGAS